MKAAEQDVLMQAQGLDPEAQERVGIELLKSAALARLWTVFG